MSQVLVVDIQDKVLAPIPNKETITENTLKLVQAAQLLNVPITISEQYPKGLGHTIKPIGDAVGDETTIFDKIWFSCMRDDNLRHHIQDYRDNARGQVIVAGIEGHVCVLQTVLDLIADGFDVYVVADAAGSRAETSLTLALRRMDRAGAFIVDTEMVLFEWLERAGTPEFKPLQALIK